MKFAMYKHRLVNADLAKPGLIYRCPFCGKRMVVHQVTRQRRAYFSHILINNYYKNPGETPEHLLGKKQLAKFFKTPHNSVVIEKYLPQINQWPDLMVNNVIIEFQCSPISINKLSERISGYSQLDLKSWWILGSPYQKRHLRSAYIARFLNYSTNLGFFILFWETKSNSLEIHYGICEYGGQFSYQIKHIFTLVSLELFIHHRQIKPRIINNFTIKQAITLELVHYRRCLFHGDSLLIWLQQQIGQYHNTLLGCPIICHLPIFDLPIFTKRALLWRIIILLSIHNQSLIKDIYRKANSVLKIPMTFCQIDHYQFLYRKAFKEYLTLLLKFHYIRIDGNGKKITRVKKPRWFSSYYDKILYLKHRY